jgi:hypothetical protein
MRGPLRLGTALHMCILSAAGLGGCTSPGTGDRWTGHFDPSVWSGALATQVERPDRYVPEGFLLATIPLSFVYDDQIHDHFEDQSVDPTVKDAASILQVVLSAVPVTIGVVDWTQGDGGRNFEVVAESLGGVVVAQQLLAHSVRRERPNEVDNTSFPSGHTSWAFAATTLIVRDIHDPTDHSFHFVDALLYLPAAFTAWERVASDHHWTSDVTCGAFLGVFLTNWIWDAHYGDDEGSRSTIFGNSGSRGVVWNPGVEVIDGQLAFGVRGGF